MLGIDGVRALEACEVDGEVELTVETTTERDWCRSCGVRAHSKGRPVVVVRDVDAFGRRARLRWRKRRWRCPERACPNKTWSEVHEAIAPRAMLADRARRVACRRVGRDGASVAQVAREYAVGWHSHSATATG
jgi:hypothetical protein